MAERVLAACGYAAWCPRAIVERRHARGRAAIEVPLYTGYILLEFALGQAGHTSLRSGCRTLLWRLCRQGGDDGHDEPEHQRVLSTL
jgi:hypothetical protein